MRSCHSSILRSRYLIACLLLEVASPRVIRAQGTPGTITGVVLDSLGTALSGAHVTVDSATLTSITDQSGEFRLPGVPAGVIGIRIRRLGYRQEARTLRVQSGSETHVEVRLAPLPVRLQTVEVRRRVEVYDSRLAGFNSRKDKHAGHFVTRDQLDRMSSARFVDALWAIPGVQLRSLRGGGTSIVLRGSRCPPLVFIDGFPADAGVMDLDMIDLSGVEGIEVYSGAASVPPEFMGARGTHSCGVIGIWSRPTRPRKQRIGELGEVDLEKLLASGVVYTSDQVDDPARMIQGSIEPVYPDSLWQARVGGRVVTEFIVDSAGVIEPGSVRIVSATHPYFESSVKAALGGIEFRPAVLGGKPVRQIVQLPFDFSPAAPDSIPSPSK